MTLYSPKLVNGLAARDFYPQFNDWSVDTDWSNPKTGSGQFNLIKWNIGGGNIYGTGGSEAVAVRFNLTNAALLDANFRYSTETYSFGNYEFYVNGLFTTFGWFTKRRQIIPLALGTFNPSQVITVAGPNPLVQDIVAAGYNAPQRLSLPSLAFPADISAAYLTLYYQLNAGCEMLIQGWGD